MQPNQRHKKDNDQMLRQLYSVITLNSIEETTKVELVDSAND